MVDLPHRALQALRECLVMFAEPRVAIGLPISKLGMVLEPPQRQHHALAAQFLMVAPAVGLGVGGWTCWRPGNRRSSSPSSMSQALAQSSRGRQPVQRTS